MDEFGKLLRVYMEGHDIALLSTLCNNYIVIKDEFLSCFKVDDAACVGSEELCKAWGWDEMEIDDGQRSELLIVEGARIKRVENTERLDAEVKAAYEYQHKIKITVRGFPRS